MNLCLLSDSVFKRAGTYDALIDATRTWTSDDVHERVSRLAGSLASRGVAAGDRIAVLLPTTAESVIAFTAALRCGAVAVPLFGRSAHSDLAAAIRDCAPTAVVTTAETADRAAAMFDTVRVRIAAGETAPHSPGWLELDALVQDGQPMETPVAREASDAALICYTSGTSGRPKGVVYTHGGAMALYGGPSRRGDGIVLTALPLNAFGAWALIGRLAFRWTLVLMQTFEPRSFLQAIQTHRVQTLALVPFMGEALVALPDADRYDVSSLRRVTLTGAHVSQFLIERLTRLLKVRPRIGYGMTEVGGGIAATVNSSKPGSVGRLVPGVDVKIMGANGATLLAGETGEICVKTPWTAQGYVGQHDGDPTVFDNGWVRTGDVGYIDSQNELFVLGRQKDLVIQGGVNVSPNEVADVIGRMPGVRDCAVVGMPHALLGEEVVACVVADARTMTETNVIEHCRATMDTRKVPVRVRFWSDIPRTALGKVDTEAVRRRLRSERQASAVSELSSRLRQSGPPVQRMLALEAIEAALRRVLAVETLSTPTGAFDGSTPLGELGLDSLRAARLAHELGETFGQPISPALFFSHPTIGQLANEIAAQLSGSEQPVHSVSVSDRARTEHEPVAIVGIGCRLPGGVETPEQFWAMLRDGTDATAEITRWDLARFDDPHSASPQRIYVRHAAMIDSAHLFDAEFFGLSDSEAGALDPQHRLSLEVTWEAIEDAGYNPLALSAECAGLFLGISSSGDGRGGLGEVPSMAVGRICHFLDLRGPALAIDTACSSSLAAVHAAVRSLRGGECDLAIAGGVHIIRSLRSFASLCDMGVLAKDGRSKAFDASADGYGRGEGAVMMVLRRLADAQADGCRVLAVIRGSAVRHDGRSSSLIAPNGRAQRDVIRVALGDAGVAAEQIDYLETHGAGTSLGDPIELDAAMGMLGHQSRKLLVGSVKSNIGHLEAAAGAAGLAKVALALAHDAVPAHLHFRSLNPLLIPLEHAFTVPTSLTPWPATPDRRRIAGVTSMGLSGTNVHVVVEEAPRTAPVQSDASAPRCVAASPVLCVSARDPVALRAQARRYADHLATMRSEDFAGACYTAAAGRNHFQCRAAVCASSPEQARDELLAIAESSLDPNASGADAAAPRIAFLFTGQGRLKSGTAGALYRSEPAFRTAIDRCADILDGMAGFRLADALFGEQTSAGSSLESMAVAQPTLFALQWALAALWQSWGIRPDAVLGHSIGECAAACVAGAMSVEDGLKLAFTRGRLLESLPGNGAMTAVIASEERVRATLVGHEPTVSIAAINGPRNVVIAGNDSAITTIEAAFTEQGIEIRRLSIPRAAHSRAVEPILDELEEVTSTIAYAPCRVPFVSTVSGQWAAEDEVSHASYWRRQMREPVRFASAMSTLLGDGYNAFVELGHAPVLTVVGRESVSDPLTPRAWLSSLSPDVDDREQMSSGLAELYRCGANPAWDEIHRGAAMRRVPLPTYPFRRKAYWSGFASDRGTTHKPRPVVDAVPPPKVSVQQGALAAPSGEQTRSTITAQIRRHVADVITGRVMPDRDDVSLLQMGLDSVRVINLVTRLGRLFRVPLRPQDLVDHPSIERFAAFVSSRIDRGALAAPPPSTSPLVILNERGARTRLCCMHPSGGRVTCYLRLRELLGDDQPLFAMQSRALDQPDREHSTLKSLASDYATVLESLPRAGPWRLIGWSMGGWVAHAVAAELESRRVAIESVGLIDPVHVSSGHPQDSLHELAFALSAVIHEVLGTPPERDVLLSAIAECIQTAERDAALLRWCEQQRLIPSNSMSSEQLGNALALYLRHFALTREYRPQPIAAPVHVWWPNEPRSLDPASLGAGTVTTSVAGGTHFSIMRSPCLDTIALDLLRPAEARIA